MAYKGPKRPSQRVKRVSTTKLQEETTRSRREKGYTENTKEKDGYIHNLPETHLGLGEVRAKRSWRKKDAEPMWQKALGTVEPVAFSLVALTGRMGCSAPAQLMAA